jgi:NAD(P)-dependent dehydrogenase (short-subunit alcohol dehydrogenase family)
MSKKLEGKVAVVTGGNSGIGLATARRFAAEGAHVFITGRRQAELDEAVKQLGQRVTGVQGDVSDLADLDRLFATVKQQQGRLYVLFVDAGVPVVAPLGSIAEEDFNKVFTINVKGLLFTVQRALPLFTDGGSIILNTSIAASKGFEASSVYSASKAAVRSFARCWTTELRHRQIRVNAISPGPIETPIVNKAGVTREQADEFMASLVAAVPRGDANGKRLFVERSGSKLFGFALELARGEPPTECIPPGGNPAFISPRSGYFTDPRQ